MAPTLDYAPAPSRWKRYLSPIPFAIAIIVGELYVLAFFCAPVFRRMFSTFKTDLPTITNFSLNASDAFRGFFAAWAWLVPVTLVVLSLVRSSPDPGDATTAHRQQWWLMMIMLVGCIVGVGFCVAMAAPFQTILWIVSSPK